jgi:hypothetical protein
MLTYSVIFFAIATVGGLVLASSVLRGKLAPWAISILHALLGASGLVLLLLEVIQGAGGSRITAALALLVIAAWAASSWPHYICAAGLRPKVLLCSMPVLPSPGS